MAERFKLVFHIETRPMKGYAAGREGRPEGETVGAGFSVPREFDQDLNRHTGLPHGSLPKSWWRCSAYLRFLTTSPIFY